MGLSFAQTQVFRRHEYRIQPQGPLKGIVRDMYSYAACRVPFIRIMGNPLETTIGNELETEVVEACINAKVVLPMPENVILEGAHCTPDMREI